MKYIVVVLRAYDMGDVEEFDTLDKALAFANENECDTRHCYVYEVTREIDLDGSDVKP